MTDKLTTCREMTGHVAHIAEYHYAKCHKKNVRKLDFRPLQKCN